MLSVVQDYQYRVMAQLQLALCTVRGGGVAEGVRRATHTIGVTSGRVDRRVARILAATEGCDDPDVRAARERLRAVAANGNRSV